MDIVDKYFKFKDLIHKSFNYVADWKEIPLEDGREYYWMLVGDEVNGTLVYGNEPFTEEDLGSEGGNFFSAPIYTQRFLNKYVYRNDNYTMMSIDTRTDGNKFLIILDNELECKDESLKEIYKKNWGNI
jgi:hypothetical protein